MECETYSQSGAQEKTRTSTTLRPQVPETCASTNSATWAIGGPTLMALQLSTSIAALLKYSYRTILYYLSLIAI